MRKNFIELYVAFELNQNFEKKFNYSKFTFHLKASDFRKHLTNFYNNHIHGWDLKFISYIQKLDKHQLQKSIEKSDALLSIQIS